MKSRCAILLLFAGLSWTAPLRAESPAALVTNQTASAADVFNRSDQILARAFRTGRSEFPIRCRGRVTRLLADDNVGIRHQRFVIRLSTGQTLLIVHNIDLTSRVAGLKMRDRVVVKGEYIWNPQGGLIHYTHRDPDGEGFHGYVRHNRVTYH